ncbi:MAG: benzoate-CoA ligase family protein [Armatimonadota bacterium]|nr:benzoate-CoA ligase family protein [Armatimonadota bacterium]MDR7433407.1 benzoate-CoA ligase family protein [Armatimonadota bacterium]
MDGSFNLATHLLDRHVDEGRGDRVAVHYGDSAVTYADLQRQAHSVAAALTRLGVEPENRVVVCLADCPAFLATYFGTLRVGAVPVLVNTYARPDDYVYYLNHSRAKVLVVHGTVLPRIREVADRLMWLRHLVVVQPDSDEPLDRHFPAPRLEGAAAYEDLLAPPARVPEPAPTSPDDMAFWMYSSGTTGRPKAVVHLHHDLLHFIPPHCQQVVGLGPQDKVFSTSKLFFSYGRNNSLDGPFLYGAQVILSPDRPEPGAVLDLLEEHRPTVFYSVPTFYAALLDYLHRTGRSVRLSFLRCCISAGEALPRAVFERWRERFGLAIFDGVGSTEVGAIYLSNRPDCLRPGSSGKILEGFEARLVGEEGRPVRAGEVGVLWVKNDGIFAGYWNDHHRTQACLAGEWFNTGDLFYQDEDGFYWYVGRADDLLKPSGLWVSPLEVEGVLLQHPAVREAAVVGAFDEAGLEKPAAFVVLREGYQPGPGLEDELKNFVRQQLPSYKCPRWVHFATELPRTTTGKLQRYRLREALRAQPVGAP